MGKRKIKFRARNKRYGVMTYCGDGEYDTDTQGQILDCFEEEYVMQFTGLIDVNGKEIYEGDIVKYDIRGDLIPKIAEMLPLDNTTLHRYGHFQELVDQKRYIEVIGNIYENKDLLEKNNGTQRRFLQKQKDLLWHSGSLGAVLEIYA